MNRKKLTALMLSTVMAFTPAAPIVASETAVHSVENAEDIAVSSATASQEERLGFFKEVLLCKKVRK